MCGQRTTFLMRNFFYIDNLPFFKQVLHLKMTPVAPQIGSTWKLAIPTFIIFVFYYVSVAGRRTEESGKSISDEKVLKTSTWNIAAINNNPFEYWISITNDKELGDNYNHLMEKVADTIKKPSVEDDKPVSNVFSQDMFDELISSMNHSGISKNDLQKVESRWNDDFKNRKIISEFIKDASIGKKRLASMPDRYTNTIKTVTGMQYRPTVINCFTGSLLSQQEWWSAWHRFMFLTPIEVSSSKGTKKYAKIFKMLKPIKRSKYPEITEEEEAISIPLQTLAAAIFDGILINVLNSKGIDWGSLRSEMCKKLNKNKNNRITDILTTTYANQEVVFLQEVSNDMLSVFERSSKSKYEVHTSQFADGDRNQNSVILLKKSLWCTVSEVTAAVTGTIENAPFAKGDLFVIQASCNMGKFIFASFHGDTDGLATIPITNAVKEYSKAHASEFKLLFGMDANSHRKPKDPKKQLAVSDFAGFYRSIGLTSCYGDKPDPDNFTTFHARTYLQPQLNKAVTYEERSLKGDKNPKDHILFSKSDFDIIETTKDNTGRREYQEGMVFPTFDFPSDHGITSATFKLL